MNLGACHPVWMSKPYQIYCIVCYTESQGLLNKKAISHLSEILCNNETSKRLLDFSSPVTKLQRNFFLYTKLYLTSGWNLLDLVYFVYRSYSTIVPTHSQTQVIFHLLWLCMNDSKEKYNYTKETQNHNRTFFSMDWINGESIDPESLTWVVIARTEKLRRLPATDPKTAPLPRPVVILG